MWATPKRQAHNANYLYRSHPHGERHVTAAHRELNQLLEDLFHGALQPLTAGSTRASLAHVRLAPQRPARGPPGGGRLQVRHSTATGVAAPGDVRMGMRAANSRVDDAMGRMHRNGSLALDGHSLRQLRLRVLGKHYITNSSIFESVQLVPHLQVEGQSWPDGGTPALI